jgi:hypothetical protein
MEKEKGKRTDLEILESIENHIDEANKILDFYEYSLLMNDRYIEETKNRERKRKWKG